MMPEQYIMVAVIAVIVLYLNKKYNWKQYYGDKTDKVSHINAKGYEIRK